MGKLPAILLYVKDWLSDDVANCSIGAQGLWLRMMFVMHLSERYGYFCINGVPIQPEAAVRKCGCTTLEQYTALLAELDQAGVPSRTDDGIIYSRRLVRDEKARVLARRNGKKGGNPSLIGGVNREVNHSLKMKMKTENGIQGGAGGGKNSVADRTFQIAMQAIDAAAAKKVK